MTTSHRTRIRTRTAAVLTTGLLTLLTAGALHHPGRLTGLLAVLTAALAPTTATRTAARHTLDLLLRLVPWYTPRN
ncbi:hypothetical protein OHA71_49430 [Streptomyces sp. NBC_00444]|uniref:hypothetical protein n=1 Tax=Streptomyces sp. NBC_00444 TaxID=2975744 RepID=UPI002E1C6653